MAHLTLRQQVELIHQMERVIYDMVVDNPMWIGDDGLPLEYSPEREALIGEFCVQTAQQVAAIALR